MKVINNQLQSIRLVKFVVEKKSCCIKFVVEKNDVTVMFKAVTKN